jgi:hypothetical protein
LCVLLLFGGCKCIISGDSKCKVYKDVHIILSSLGGSVEPLHHNVALLLTKMHHVVEILNIFLSINS